MMIHWKCSRRPVPYLQAVWLMEKWVEEIAQRERNELVWILEHPHVYTIGPRTPKDDIKDPQGIPIVPTNRGGKATYHGPGQKIIYVLLNLKHRGRDLRRFVWQLEQALLQTLNDFHLHAERREGRTGLWIPSSLLFQKEQKIAALGIRVRKWITFHGASLNVCPELSYFQHMTPCGLKNYGVTSMKEQGVQVHEEEMNQALKKNMNAVFQDHRS